jgi:hypothetical protein
MKMILLLPPQASVLRSIEYSLALKAFLSTAFASSSSLLPSLAGVSPASSPSFSSYPARPHSVASHPSSKSPQLPASRTKQLYPHGFSSGRPRSSSRMKLAGPGFMSIMIELLELRGLIIRASATQHFFPPTSDIGLRIASCMIFQVSLTACEIKQTFSATTAESSRCATVWSGQDKKLVCFLKIGWFLNIGKRVFQMCVQVAIMPNQSK